MNHEVPTARHSCEMVFVVETIILNTVPTRLVSALMLMMYANHNQ